MRAYRLLSKNVKYMTVFDSESTPSETVKLSESSAKEIIEIADVVVDDK